MITQPDHLLILAHQAMAKKEYRQALCHVDDAIDQCNDVAHIDLLGRLREDIQAKVPPDLNGIWGTIRGLFKRRHRDAEFEAKADDYTAVHL